VSWPCVGHLIHTMVNCRMFLCSYCWCGLMNWIIKWLVELLVIFGSRVNNTDADWHSSHRGERNSTHGGQPVQRCSYKRRARRDSVTQSVHCLIERLCALQALSTPILQTLRPAYIQQSPVRTCLTSPVYTQFALQSAEYQDKISITR